MERETERKRDFISLYVYGGRACVYKYIQYIYIFIYVFARVSEIQKREKD